MYKVQVLNWDGDVIQTREYDLALDTFDYLDKNVKEGKQVTVQYKPAFKVGDMVRKARDQYDLRRKVIAITDGHDGIVYVVTQYTTDAPRVFQAQTLEKADG